MLKAFYLVFFVTPRFHVVLKLFDLVSPVDK